MITKIKKILACLSIVLLTIFYSKFVLSKSNSFQFSLSRMTYNEGAKSISIGLRNNENSPYLVQAAMKWLDEDSGINLLDKDENTPFIITPLLEKIEPNEYYTWQIKFTGADNLPTDRESVFIAQFRLIPSSSNKEVDMQVNIIRALNFKIYYRPKALNGVKIENVEDKLSFSVIGNKIIAKNDSPIYLAFNSIKINGKEIDLQELSKNVPPLGTQEYIFPQEKVNEIKWQLFDENLFPLKEKTLSIK